MTVQELRLFGGSVYSKKLIFSVLLGIRVLGIIRTLRETWRKRLLKDGACPNIVWKSTTVHTEERKKKACNLFQIHPSGRQNSRPCPHLHHHKHQLRVFGLPHGKLTKSVDIVQKLNRKCTRLSDERFLRRRSCRLGRGHKKSYWPVRCFIRGPSRKEHCDTQVLIRFIDDSGYKLGRWVGSHRQRLPKMNDSNVRDERIKLLNSIQFEWSNLNRNFCENIEYKFSWKKV